MSDLAVTHLFLDESDRPSVGPERRCRAFAPPPVVVGRLGVRDGVSFGFVAFAPSVEYHHSGFCHVLRYAGMRIKAVVRGAKEVTGPASETEICG